MLDAAVEDIVDHGIDGVRTARVAAAAGLTTGALFGYWADVDELLIDVWELRLCPTVLEQLDASLAYVRAARQAGAPSQPPLSFDGPFMTAAADMVIAARRQDVLREVVARDVTAWIDHRSGPDDRMLVEMVAAVVWGAAVLGSSDLATGTDWRAILHQLAAPPVDPAVLDARDLGDDAIESGPSLGAVMVGDSGDPVEDRLRAELIEATEAVVASRGLAGATVTRIARQAGVDRMALYRRYEGVEELLLDTLRAHIRARVVEDSQGAIQGLTTNDPPSAISFGLVATTVPARAASRALRLEVHLIARHHPAIAEELRDLVDAALDRLGPIVDLGRARVPAERAVRLYQAALLGLCILVDIVDRPYDRRELFAAVLAPMHAFEREVKAAIGEWSA
jgi:AcrR family transcriptional regulator